MTTLLIGILFAYCIGSLSSAVIICRLMRLPDPRATGSHNPGATNVLRIGGKKAALFTLICDVLKGLVPVLIARGVGLPQAALGYIALAAFLGHLYPVFFGFKGGKGVATGIGGLFALNAMIGLLALITWLIVVAIFRYSSLGAIVAAILIPVYNIFLGNIHNELALLIMLLFLLWRHRGNLQRLREGTESKVGRKK